MKPYLRRILCTVNVFCLLSLAALSACAVGPRLVDHSFGFDAVAESPDIDVLDYRYGQSTAPGARMPEWAKTSIGKSGGTNTNGPMLVGDTLYVKWRLKSTGEVLEDTVSLAGRLPSDITNHRVYFVVEGRQLNVYLVSPDRRSPDMPAVGPKKYQDRKV